MKINYQKLLSHYEDENGQNPFFAALNLITFIKTIPFQIVKALVVALGIYCLMNGVLFYISASWSAILFSLLGGLIPVVFLGVTGSLKFITDAFLENVSDLLLGIMKPIDNIYDVWKKNSNEKISRKEFTARFLKEAIVPKILQMIPKVFFKKQLTKRLEKVVDNVIKTNEKELDDSFSDDDIEAKKTYLKKSITGVEKAINASKKGFNTPFNWVLRIALFFWAVLILLQFI